MAGRKGRNSKQSKAEQAVAAADAAQDIPQVEEQSQIATIVPPEARTPQSKRGTSTVDQPVAFVWGNSHNLCRAAIAKGEPVPSRRKLVQAAIDAGVAYYTARTQVQAYLRASNNGTQVPAKLPRGLKIGA